MKLERIPYDPSSVIDFYEEGLTALGGLCERTWHDRLEVVAEGPAARLWKPDGELHEIELTFAPADATSARDAAREVFPGCPLTFHLAENLQLSPLPLERVVLAGEERDRAPEPEVAEKLWRSRVPETTRWRLASAFKPDFHFSLVALTRCEIQAIDQHWTLHRLAVALPDGEPDEALARDFSFAHASSAAETDVPWPSPAPDQWHDYLKTALETDLVGELDSIRSRQEHYLRRELDRIDDYFENYERELTARADRSHSEATRMRVSERLAAAQAEHNRRRADQVARHEIRVQLHWTALILAAEPAWRATLAVERARVPETLEALFVPRARRWFAG